MKTATKPLEQERTSAQISKWIKAPAAKVYEAWTRPALINQWFAPDMKTMTPQAEADFRVGGSWKICMKKAGDENSPVVGGKYIEIVANKKLVFSWIWEGTRSCGSDCATTDAKPQVPVQVDSVVTVEFKEKNGGTELVLTHERLPNEEQVTRHTEGWTGCLENLAHFAEAK